MTDPPLPATGKIPAGTTYVAYCAQGWTTNPNGRAHGETGRPPVDEAMVQVQAAVHSHRAHGPQVAGDPTTLTVGQASVTQRTRRGASTRRISFACATVSRG